MAGVSVNNPRSQRAFEKAGFVRGEIIDVPGEPAPEVMMVLRRPNCA
jgi:RimJ/RimL family protein N-acetyltransferase